MFFLGGWDETGVIYNHLSRRLQSSPGLFVGVRHVRCEPRPSVDGLEALKSGRKAYGCGNEAFPGELDAWRLPQ